jgi:hypothetical protein
MKVYVKVHPICNMPQIHLHSIGQSKSHECSQIHGAGERSLFCLQGNMVINNTMVDKRDTEVATDTMCFYYEEEEYKSKLKKNHFNS